MRVNADALEYFGNREESIFGYMSEITLIAYYISK
jgi:hypothetical protein